MKTGKNKNSNDTMHWLMAELAQLSDAYGKIPSQRALAKRHGCSLGTMRKAIAVLEARGFLSTRHGHGTFLSQSNPVQVQTAPSKKSILMLSEISVSKDEQVRPFAQYKIALCKGIQKAAHLMDCNLMLKTFEADVESTEKNIQEFEEMVLSDTCAGVVLTSVWQKDIQQRIFQLGKPGIVVDHWAETGVKWDSVEPDTHGHVRDMVVMLANMGHQQITLLDRTESNNPELPDGYEAAMDLLGLQEYKEVIESPRELSRLPKIFKQQFDDWEHHDRIPDAIVSHAPAPLFALFEEIKRRGLRVPEDISVVSFPDPYSLNEQQVSGIAINWEDMGKKTVSKLFERIRNPRKPVEVIKHMSPFQFGETVAAHMAIQSK